jgi:hypothetical protein
MVTQIINRHDSQLSNFFPQNTHAAQLCSDDRKRLSVQVLARTKPVTVLAATNGVSRKFLYKNAAKAESALDKVFNPIPEDEEVLFYLPITKKWIRHFIQELILVCHSSFRGAIELLRDMFNYEISIGTIHNVIRKAIKKARHINNSEDLSQIRVGAPDEIFQAGKPVLVGCDVKSTYCYLLSLEEHRDETTWGVHLLDLSERGLNPDYTIADMGKGLRAGQAAAWGTTPCHADVFHGECNLTKLATYLERRALGCISARENLEQKMKRAKQSRSGRKLSKKLWLSRQAEAKALELAQDVQLLTDWMKNDVLSLSGPEPTVREELFDFIIKELSEREHLCSHRITPVRRTLHNQRKEILAFTHVLDEKLTKIADNFSIPKYLVHRVCELQGMSKSNTAYWQQETNLRKKLYGRLYDDVQDAVLKAMADTPRASSVVENLNSRLRNYFFLRKQIGNDYLELLRFFLNHRRFMRSEWPERVNKSPTEIMTGKTHPHWLDLLDAQDSSYN